MDNHKQIIENIFFVLIAVGPIPIGFYFIYKSISEGVISLDLIIGIVLGAIFMLVGVLLVIWTDTKK